MRLLWRIFLSFFACALLVLAMTAWFASHSLGRFYREKVAEELRTQAMILADELAPHFRDSNWPELDRHCKAFRQLTQTRVTVILTNGVVIGDSDQDPATLENHADRPEFLLARDGPVGQSVRFSDTTRSTLMYLAVPVRQDGSLVGVVRTSQPLWVVNWTLRNTYRHVTAGVLLIAMLFALAAFYFARQTTRPLDDMRRAAEQLARGELHARIAQPDAPEMAALAGALNRMAAQLDERIQTIARQNNRQNAVFASMVEGVLALDTEGRILEINDAAVQWMQWVPDQAKGRTLREAVRNVELQKFVGAVESADCMAETEITLHDKDERILQLHGTPLKDAAGNKLGVLIVGNDITRLRRLETVRQDFVANVSHELKTPITALKGCVETLADPAHRTAGNDERLLAMMDRQVERLNSIVEDLLTLSRIEHDARHKRVATEPGPIANLLRSAVLAHAEHAATRNITVTVQCDDSLTAPIHAPLLEQAVGNLIDNAIKYSDERTQVTVAGTPVGNDVEIRVADQGPGIEKKHWPRIFERFYRVDQARSRALGGTGLGLAIVKHIALAHGGTVAVDSVPGRGSVFSIRIPRQ